MSKVKVANVAKNATQQETKEPAIEQKPKEAERETANEPAKEETPTVFSNENENADEKAFNEISATAKIITENEEPKIIWAKNELSTVVANQLRDAGFLIFNTDERKGYHHRITWY